MKIWTALLIAMLFHIQRYLFMSLQVPRTPRLCVSLVIITISLFTYYWTLALLITSWILQLHQSSIFLFLIRPSLMSGWLMENAYIVRDNVKIYLLTSKEFQLPQIFTSFLSGDMMLFWVDIGSRPSVPFYGISPNWPWNFVTKGKHIGWLVYLQRSCSSSHVTNWRNFFGADRQFWF
jgi:hypothetical protein